MLGGQSPVEIDVPVDALTRPRSWGECLREGWGDHDATGPCPWVSCRHHLAWAFAIYGSAVPGSEAAVAEVEKVDLDAMPETCALRVATFGLQRAVGANEADEGRSSEQEDGEAERARRAQGRTRALREPHAACGGACTDIATSNTASTVVRTDRAAHRLRGGSSPRGTSRRSFRAEDPRCWRK